jgi:hypothetical protein|tara:strand:+ start:2338 stop:3273 length:936 start_codon:yes stop_codon:yes gene_type:complete
LKSYLLHDLSNNEKLERFAELYFLANKKEKRLAIIGHELESLFVDLEIHRKIMHDEHQDVIKLEKMSKHFLFAKILGDREHELERERQEYLEAVLEYNAIAHEIEVLQYEKEILDRKKLDKEGLKKQRDYYLKFKEQRILYNSSDRTIKKLNGEIERLHLLQREIKEAVEVANTASTHLKKAMHHLRSMVNFGAYVIEGMTYSKKQILNKAINEVIQVKVHLKKLDMEMSDIYNNYELPSMYIYDAFIDSFHQNLITDWVLRNKLKSAKSLLESGIEQLLRITATLKHDAEKSKKKLKFLTEEKRMYVLNL